MESAIHVVWWIGLIGALIPTVVILKEASLILKTLRDILALATFTGQAAHGIARNVAVRETLRTMPSSVEALPPVGRRLAAASAALERRLARLAGARER